MNNYLNFILDIFKAFIDTVLTKKNVLEIYLFFNIIKQFDTDNSKTYQKTKHNSIIKALCIKLYQKMKRNTS